jgi:hypothetical protein
MKRFLAISAKIALIALVTPFAVIAASFSALFGFREKLTAAEVVLNLRNFLDGSGGEWDWDDFVSVPIADPALDHIRRRAAAVELPASEKGYQTLRLLLIEAETLAAAAQAALSIPNSPSLR